MKLIIEIPEEQYNDIVKYLTNNDGNYAYSDFNLREIIRNGTPYNPSGDAISREALKEAINKVVAEEIKEDEKWAVGLRYALKLIDNAQAIPLPNEQIAWEQGYEAGLAQGKQDRPQGEWGKWIISEIQCPNCFRYFETDYYSTEELKKCPNCEADMRGGAE